jgi:ABC-type nitrate/sulfonate/bicarbonate transport system ATPase subunit
MALIIKDLSFLYDKKYIFNKISLRLEKGEIGTLIGASGSGKTTLFKLLTGLLPVSEGDISIFGMSGTTGSQNIAYMMQQDILLPWRTALDNVLLVSELGPNALNSPEDRKEALKLLNEVGLSGCENLYPEELSGGMRQRVSLARALLRKRPLLLLDEPFGALDVVAREQMYQLLRRLKEKFGMTILMITHDFRDALFLSDHVFLLTQSKIGREWHIDPNLRDDVVYMARVQHEIHEVLAATYGPTFGVLTNGVS